ncbi:MAG: imidazolonepropionase [Planctomycetota bacterium]
MTPPLLIRNARVLRLDAGPRRGRDAMNDLRSLDACDVLVRDGVIAQVGPGLTAHGDAEELHAAGRVLIPGFVDCHTHACWAGERYDEWAMRQAGATYLELLEAGGGIMSTVRAVRAATLEELTSSLVERLNVMLAGGTTTLEVKSGYGLTTEDELKMLRAIANAATQWQGTVVSTACIGHAVDPEASDPIETTISETLPAVVAEFPGITIDAYCERAAWSLEDSVRLFERARELGCPCRVHTDQFNELGMTAAAIEKGFVSVDHLEASGPETIRAVAESETAAVVLPCSGFHTDQRYADGRALIDSGATVAIATNCNPGSSPCYSLPLAAGLAVRCNGLTPAESISAITTNAASVLGLSDRGYIDQGARADLVLLRHTHETALTHDLGGRHIDAVFLQGERVV